MRSRYVQVVVVGLAALTALGVVAAALGWWHLTLAVLVVLGGASAAFAFDADRRARSLREQLRADLSRAERRERKEARVMAPTVSEVDVVGAVRVLQAQYVGRLDRLQVAVERALERVDREPQPGADAEDAVPGRSAQS